MKFENNNLAYKHIWSVFVFDQTRCAFGQLCKPNPSHNLTLTLKLTQYHNPDPNHSPNINPNPIASALHN